MQQLFPQAGAIGGAALAKRVEERPIHLFLDHEMREPSGCESRHASFGLPVADRLYDRAAEVMATACRRHLGIHDPLAPRHAEGAHRFDSRYPRLSRGILAGGT
ncbi:MAG TPA: hypothetical protein VNM68_00020 [Candidatus Polarisedimenticolia bacterium]|nr:hypothetical protein [Candidatus Polarisedimenticolia bacterium]